MIERSNSPVRSPCGLEADLVRFAALSLHRASTRGHFFPLMLSIGDTDVLDFEVQKFTRRCAKCQRELARGERFYSVLEVEGADVIRRDYGQECWEGAPDRVLGWWRSEVPDPRAQRVHWAPNDVILHYFLQVHEDPDKLDLAYVLALLMIRRRIFRLESEESEPCEQPEPPRMRVYCPRNETEYRITVAEPGQERALAIQQELGQLLFAKADNSPNSPTNSNPPD